MPGARGAHVSPPRFTAVVVPTPTDIHARTGFGAVRSKSDPVSKYAEMQRKWDQVSERLAMLSLVGCH